MDNEAVLKSCWGLFFSDYTTSSEKIAFVEADKRFTQDAKNGKLLNTFFSNLVKNLNIPFAEKVSHSVLKAIFKYRKNSNLISINNVANLLALTF